MKNIFKHIIGTIIQAQAKIVLKKYQPKIVAITGSVGKTSTKDAIYSVMAGSFHVRKSEKSFNSEIGVPLTILGLNNAWSNPFKWLLNIYLGFKLIISKSTYPEWLVLEIGADRPGDIKKLSSWIKPDVVVITKFAKVPVHIEYFKSKEAVVAEKGNLVTALKHDGTLILNSDDEDVFAFRSKVTNKVLTYGLFGDSQIRASNYSVYYGDKNEMPLGINFKVDYAGNSVPLTIIGSLGNNNIYASLAALAVGINLGLNLVKCSENISHHELPRGRMRLIKGINNSVIIDDTYNSSPVASTSALETLKGIKTKGRRVAVLADMMELGRHTVDSHREIGVLAATACDFLITVGLRSRTIAESAIDSGLSEKNVLQFDDSISAADYVKNIVQAGDIILIKGSQSTRMERVVKAVMLEPDRAADLLVRQDNEWQNR